MSQTGPLRLTISVATDDARVARPHRDLEGAAERDLGFLRHLLDVADELGAGDDRRDGDGEVALGLVVLVDGDAPSVFAELAPDRPFRARELVDDDAVHCVVAVEEFLDASQCAFASSVLMLPMRLYFRL